MPQGVSGAMLVGVSEIASACAVGSKGLRRSRGSRCSKGSSVTVLVDSITRRRFVWLAALTGGSLALSGCAGDGSNGTGGSTGVDGSGGEGAGDGQNPEDAAVAARAAVDERIGAMTLEQKVAQLFIVTPEALVEGVSQVTQAGDMTREGVTAHPVGGIVYFAQNLLDPEQTTTMLANVKQFYADAGNVAPFIAVDEEGGTVVRVADNEAFGAQDVGDASALGSAGDTEAVPFIAMAKDGPHHMDMNISRQQFNELTADLVDKTVIPVENALHDAGLNKNDIGMVLLVGGSTRIPAVQDKVRQIMGKEPSRNLNPDECVALGAAVQGGKLGNQLMPGSAASEIILMDVTPLSLSIETVGGIASRLIERNTTIPTRHSQIFTTAGNFQTSVDIKVFQGERRFTRDNKLLGNFKLNGIKRAMAGVPQIEVTFDIDANGIVNVSAKDLGTGREQSITITSSSNMSEEEIERAKWEAEVYGEQDKKNEEYWNSHIEAENTLKRAEGEYSQNKKVWDKAKKKAVKEAMNQLKRIVVKCKPEKMNADLAHQLDELRINLENVLNN